MVYCSQEMKWNSERERKKQKHLRNECDNCRRSVSIDLSSNCMILSLDKGQLSVIDNEFATTMIYEKDLKKITFQEAVVAFKWRKPEKQDKAVTPSAIIVWRFFTSSTIGVMLYMLMIMEPNGLLYGKPPIWCKQSETNLLVITPSKKADFININAQNKQQHGQYSKILSHVCRSEVVGPLNVCVCLVSHEWFASTWHRRRPDEMTSVSKHGGACYKPRVNCDGKVFSILDVGQIILYFAIRLVEKHPKRRLTLFLLNNPFANKHRFSNIRFTFQIEKLLIKNSGYVCLMGYKWTEGGRFGEGRSETIRRILNTANIRVGFQRGNTLRSALVQLKDRLPANRTRDCVYKIKCSDCIKVYIGQTARELHTRIGEHKRKINKPPRNADEYRALLKDSAIAEHALDTGHKIDLENVEVLRQGLLSTSQRLMAEAIEIAKHPSVNRIEGVELARVWRTVLDQSS
ncbi:hypothetical protein CLF_104685 [Clonorchis sinensis]|uniref:C2H2-type domain-containing protein n=1 Tax=Clonorchis sinensis TaxID=79923 RepID=G7YC43_CLOSI|nr:hypothetical protein CLF_104685 [Clonorchis sinensis]